jgi:hypothetical protein
MATLLPGAGLPEAFTTEPATGSHAAEVFELLAAELTAAFGLCPDTEEDVRANLEPAEGGRSMQLLVRERDGGSVAQWWAALRDPGDPVFHAWTRTHPRLPESVGDDLTAPALSLSDARQDCPAPCRLAPRLLSLRIDRGIRCGSPRGRGDPTSDPPGRAWSAARQRYLAAGAAVRA